MEAGKDGSVTDDEYFTANESPDLFPRHNGTEERFVQAQLEHIPTEISQLILSHVSDAFSLRNLILTNATFYHSFSAAHDLILNDVLLNEFSLRVLPDALATLFSGRLSLHDHSAVEVFLEDKYQHSVSTAPEGWTLSDALKLSRIRTEVEYFATDFASSLTSHPITGSPLDRPLVLSTSELDRIRSALYRFELYCNCFRQSKKQPGTRSCDRRRAFFDKFSPWEIEQLVTMYEYLFRKLSVAFDDVARHDVEWGELSIPFYDNNHPPDNHHQEHYLSLGLGFLRRVAAARTYDKRYQLLSSNFGSDSDFVWPALAEQDDDGTGLILGDLTDEVRESILRPPFGDDPDKGPAKAWQWAHEREILPYVYFQLDQRHLRQRGYVMLDLQRLRELGMFQEPFHFERKFDSEAFDARFEEMRESWMKRSKIWLDGGRGYWSAEGQSKIWYIYDKFGDWKVKSAPLEKSAISQPGEPLRYQNLAN